MTGPMVTLPVAAIRAYVHAVDGVLDELEPGAVSNAVLLILHAALSDLQTALLEQAS